MQPGAKISRDSAIVNTINERIARAARPLQTTWLGLLSLLLAARYTWMHANYPLWPDNHLSATAWFGWADQSAYLAAARGWASGNLNPAQHLYPAGYALLGALFVGFTPAQPFFIPNLLCCLASLWLFAALGARLGRGIAGIRVVSALVFVMVTVADLHALSTWVVPWTSTPAATLTFASLLLAIRYADDGRHWLGVGSALLAGLLALFRPTDALVIVPCVATYLLATLYRFRSGWRPALVAMFVAGSAFAIGPALLIATHVATHGWVLGYYFKQSSLIGFEWRLLPLRWVTLLLSPKPLYPEGMGFAEVYWYTLPGLAGIIAAVLTDRGRRLRHFLVGGTAIVFVCVYLCYRDLQVLGLFLFRNQHYFKWTLPVFGLYTCALPYLLFARRGFTAVAAALAIVALMACWRAKLVVVAAEPAATVLSDGSGLALPHGLSGLGRAILVSVPDDFLSLYFGKHTLDAAGRTFIANADFKVLPVPFGLMVVPLRPLPAEPSVLHLAEPLRLDPAAPVLTARQAIIFGLPCSIAPRRAICRSRPILKSP